MALTAVSTEKGITTYQLQFEDLKLTVEDVLRQLGYPNGTVPEPVTGITNELLQTVAAQCSIKAGLVIKEQIQVHGKTGHIKISNYELTTRKIITNQMKGASQVALFVCTLGSSISDWSQQMMQQGDYLEGYILDKIGSLGVEAAMDLVQEDFGKTMLLEGSNTTHRYSPGYCNWPVSEQQVLFQLLPFNFCGVKLSPASLMDPIKSISGIIGIGADVVKRNYQCHACEDQDCIMRPGRVSA